MKEERMPLGEDRQIFYNMVIPGTALVIVAIIFGYVLVKVNGALPRGISLSGAILIILASFRMIRGASYDKFLCYPREYFKYDKRVVEENGQKFVIKTLVKPGFRRAINATLECVWCTGFWTTLIAIFLYYISPVTYFVLLLLALSGVATFLQLLANIAGNKYEILEKENEQMGE